jgi:acyl carrier protein
MAASREEVYERVKEVLTEQLGVEDDQITEEASFQDAQKITTVGQAVDYVTSHQ